jgi:hypothetical protein
VVVPSMLCTVLLLNKTGKLKAENLATRTIRFSPVRHRPSKTFPVIVSSEEALKFALKPYQISPQKDAEINMPR